MRKLLYIVILGTLLVACANLGSPDGGAYDETPPKIVGTSPSFGGTNVKTKKIVLQFDENIKLDNQSEKVVISPPQINQPDIDATGKKITVTLNDSLKPGVTYTIDFSDAIADNNEGNPMADYAFTFSTGENVDTFQISGYVLDASNLEPIKGIMVGLYSIGVDEEDIPDSIFTTREFERVSRTDAAGHFIIKGLNPEIQYRVFALKDMDQNFLFSQKAEMLGFSRQIISSSAKPDIRPDTVWHDSIYYDSIVYTPYTHFYPDDIVITAFTEEGQNRALMKRERNQLEFFSLYFTAPDSTLPEITGLNFNATDAFIVESNERKDTLTYWIRDSLVYNKDTLSMAITYNATDTLGQLVPKTDTLALWSKQSYDKIQKKIAKDWEDHKKEYIKEYKQELKRKRAEANSKKSEGNEAAADSILKTLPDANQKDEDIEVPPMPETFIEIRMSNSNINPDQNIDITFLEPVDTAYIEKFHFFHTVDSVNYDLPFMLRRIPGTSMKYRFYAEWQPDSTYTLLVDTGAVVNIYGKRLAGLKRTINVKGMDKFSQLTVNLINADTTAIVSLLNMSGKEVKRQKVKDGHVDFFFIDPGAYYLSLFYDRNGDGEWTTGDYALQKQAEETYFYPNQLNLKAQWEITQDWNPTATPLFKQKPEKITKQKPETKKERRGKNAQRERDKNNRR